MARARALHTLDLTAGLLLRARLLAVEEQEHLLLVNHHHIASDGWSRSVLARDLVELYNAHHSNRSPQLQPLWGFYARRGVRTHPIFQHHSDFMKPELMPKLAEALEMAIQRVDR